MTHVHMSDCWVTFRGGQPTCYGLPGTEYRMGMVDPKLCKTTSNITFVLYKYPVSASWVEQEVERRVWGSAAVIGPSLHF